MGLIKEKQVPKENLLIVAAPCDGMLDAELAQQLIGQSQIVSAEERDGTVTIKDDTGKQTKFDRKELLAEACRFCTHRDAPVSDITIDKLPKSSNPLASNDRFEEYLKKSTTERWEQFCNEFSKCILCNACRSACPNCYCKVCFADRTRPNWTGSGAELHDIISYHLGRIFHQAGRCVDCGACARACPMDVDLRTFTYKLVADAEKLFGHVAGLEIEQAPLLQVFNDDDSDNFITEPE